MPEMMLYGIVGQDVTAVNFINELNSLGDTDEITVRVNSKGGSVFDGYAIYNALSRHSARVVVEIEAIAASAASYIAMAGDEIRICENSEMMVHCGAVGLGLDNYFNAKQLKTNLIPELAKVATALERIDGQICGMYAARTGHKAETWMRLMEAETTFTAEEAVKKGLADTMIPNKGKPSARQSRRVAAQVAIDLHALASVAEQINREIPEFVAPSVIAESTNETVVEPVAEAPEQPEVNLDEYLAGLQARVAEVQE